MADQVPLEINEERHAKLLKAVTDIGAEHYSQFMDQNVRILVEGTSRRNEQRLQGRTSCNKIVVFEGNERHIGQLIDLKVYRVGSFTLYGDPAIINLD